MANRAIVCGGRDFTDQASAFAYLDALHARLIFSGIMHGNARGADKIGAAWATLRGLPCQAFPADWVRQGKAAGPIRNALMAKSGARHCIAFPGGIGTSDMRHRAKVSGLRLWLYPELRDQGFPPGSAL